MADIMDGIAPFNYERWAVMVSPLLVPDVVGVKSAFGLRHDEQLTQVSASLGQLDSRKKESLIEQEVPPPPSQRNATKTQSPPPPLPTTSHPAEWLLRQPLPMAVIASARGQSAPDPRKITQLYTPPDSPPGSSVRISG